MNSSTPISLLCICNPSRKHIHRPPPRLTSTLGTHPAHLPLNSSLLPPLPSSSDSHSASKHPCCILTFPARTVSNSRIPCLSGYQVLEWAQSHREYSIKHLTAVVMTAGVGSALLKKKEQQVDQRSRWVPAHHPPEPAPPIASSRARVHDFTTCHLHITAHPRTRPCRPGTIVRPASALVHAEQFLRAVNLL